MKIMKNILLGIVLSIISIFIMFIMLELTIKFAGFYEYPPQLYTQSSSRAFKHSKNFKGKDGYGCTVSTNNSGFRDINYPKTKKEGVTRVLVLGDSVTFGVALESEATYAKQLEKLLNDKSEKTYEVMNTGVRGYNTYQQLQVLKEDGLVYSPDVVVVGFVLNDAEPFDHQSGRIPKKYAVLIAIKDFLKKYTYTYAFLRKRMEFLVAKNNAKKYQDKYLDQFSQTHRGWRECSSAMKELSDICKEKQIKLVVLLIPRIEYFQEENPYDNIYMQVMNEWSKYTDYVIDGRIPFQGMNPDDLKIFPTDLFHYNEEGNSILAKMLYEKILRLEKE